MAALGPIGYDDKKKKIVTTEHRSVKERELGRAKTSEYVCVCVCVLFLFILDIKFVGRTSRGHTGGRSQDFSSTLFLRCVP